MLALAFAGCRATKAGTHVENVDKGAGEKVYVAGAAAPGINEEVACRGAVQRSVAAVALEFGQDHDDIAEEIGEALGVEDGRVFLSMYAKEQALDASVLSVDFNPIEHLCMASVNWKPPLFVKDAILKFAEGLKAKELAEAEVNNQPAGSAPVAAPAPAAAPAAYRPSSPPPAAASVAGAAPAAAPAAPACPKQKSRLQRVLAGNQKAVADFDKCMGKTDNDETICHRYKLYVDKAQKDEATAGQSVVDCVNAGLSTKIRVALTQNLPGHAAVSVETRGDGTLILWTFSPVDQTAFAFEMTAAGAMGGRTPLAANQLQWVREQLGL